MLALGTLFLTLLAKAVDLLRVVIDRRATLVETLLGFPSGTIFELNKVTNLLGLLLLGPLRTPFLRVCLLGPLSRDLALD